MFTHLVWGADTGGKFSDSFNSSCSYAKSPFAIMVGDWATRDRIILCRAVPPEMTFSCRGVKNLRKKRFICEAQV